MTEGAMRILAFLKKNKNKEFTTYDILENTNITLPTITGTLNGLIKRGYVIKTREDVFSARFKGEKTKTMKYYQLTEEGFNYDPIQEEREKEQQRLEEKAARKHQRELVRKMKILEENDYNV